MIEIRIAERGFQIHETAILSSSIDDSSVLKPIATKENRNLTIKEFIGRCLLLLCDEFALSLSIHRLVGLSDGITTYNLTQEIPKTLPQVFTVVYQKDERILSDGNCQQQHSESNDLIFLCDQLLNEISMLSEAIAASRSVKPFPREKPITRSPPPPQPPKVPHSNRIEYHRTMSRTLSEIEKVDHVFQACSTGNVDDLLCYLQLYGKELIDFKNATSFTPLHHACFSGQREICRVLLDHGADVTIPAKVGMTCLHLAATAGHPQIIQLLLEYGADPFVQDMLGNTVLDRAKMGNHQEIIELIRSVVANHQADDEDHTSE
jgi:hypothetical protein